MSKKDMLGVAVRKLATLPVSTLGIACDFLEKVANPEWKDAAGKFLRKEPIWQEYEQKIYSNPPIITPKPFDPAKFIGKDWTVWRGPINGKGLKGEENVDLRSLELTKIDVSKILLKTCLIGNENRIPEEEKLTRLIKKPDFIRHGGNIFMGFLKDYLENNESSALEWLHRNRGVNFLDFLGTIIRRPDGSPWVLSLIRNDDGRWQEDCLYLYFTYCNSGSYSSGSAS